MLKATFCLLIGNQEETTWFILVFPQHKPFEFTKLEDWSHKIQATTLEWEKI